MTFILRGHIPWSSKMPTALLRICSERPATEGCYINSPLISKKLTFYFCVLFDSKKLTFNFLALWKSKKFTFNLKVDFLDFQIAIK